MRKITVSVTHRVPSWRFCTLDNFTADDRFSKETCQFCIKTKDGYRCMLYDKGLAADMALVHKCPQCVDATAGYQTTVEIEEVPEVREPDMIINPKDIIKHAVTRYKSSVAALVAQGYPQELAEMLATKYVLGER